MRILVLVGARGVKARLLVGVVVGVAVFAALGGGDAFAGGSAAWTISSAAGPTIFSAGGKAEFIVTATNVGSASSSGLVEIVDKPPAGFTAKTVEGENSYRFQEEIACPLVASPTCETSEAIAPGDSLRIVVEGEVEASLGEGEKLVNDVAVSESGVQAASSEGAALVGSSQAAFGIADFKTAVSGLQAGGHPNFTTSFTLNQREEDVPVASPRSVEVDLPPGFVGNPLATRQCNLLDVVNRVCPEDDAVGAATAVINPPGTGSLFAVTVLVYSIPAPPGEPAAFAFNIAGLATVRLDASVRSDGDYGVRVSLKDLSEAAPILSSSVTLWGVPEEHNGPGENFAEFSEVTEEIVTFGGKGHGNAVPFMTSPQICRGDKLTEGLTSLEADLSVSSWAEPSASPAKANALLPTPTGCDLDSTLFTPSISLATDTAAPDAPAGYEVDLHVPQKEEPTGLATPTLQNAVVTLPLGTRLSPSAADGLQACSEAQIGLHSLGAAECPEASKVGTVEVLTPLLALPLTGYVYLAKQGENPFGSLFAIYVVAEGSGVVVKLAGDVKADANTGQLTTTFSNNPQLPFSDLRLHFNDGSRAPLVNPPTCGPATMSAELTPYTDEHPVTVTSGFDVEETTKPCAPLGFAPTFTAGTTDNEAGTNSTFGLELARSDRDQEFAGVSVQMPQGLLGTLKNVVRCPEPQAAAGTCGADSLVGHVIVGSGAGPTPVYLPQPGRREDPVYLTGPYNGAPFGLAIVVYPEAGPFTLKGGLPEVVRAAINVNPTTAQITVTSAAFPTMIEGVPLQVKAVDVLIDRKEFIFNPTSCEPLSIAGTVTGTQGASANVSSKYQASACSNLAFKPSFTVSTNAATVSRAGGASLDVKVGYPQGKQANIKSVAVSLPKQLPSRLSTIQKACPDTTFDANPASCPPGSMIGTGTAISPVLANPLTGPAYLVSHGGAAFPDLEVVLQGEGITIDLDGSINISKAGITSSTFANVPDVPVSSFDLTLPTGEHSALTTAGNLCTQALLMPTTITAQNGAQITQNTHISVSGCKPSVTITKAKVSGKSLALTVTLTAQGALQVSGKGLKSYRKTLAVGTHTIKIALSKSGLAARGHHTKTKIKVTLKAASGSAGKTKTLRL